MPDSVLGAFNPDALSFQSDVREIVFQSLRETLGAQFTEKEGERLVAASFNPLLSEEKNIARLQRLYTKTVEAKDAKERAFEYFSKNRTLKGYIPENTDFDSMINAVVQPSDLEDLTDDQITTLYENGSEPERKIILEFVRKRDQK